MSHWFHRNPLKATAVVNFDLKMIVSDSQALKLCSELRQARSRLLDIVADANHEVHVLETAFNHYLSLLQGFLVAVDEEAGESKLRYSVRFRWTHSMMGNTPETQQDVMFELVSISHNVAMWYAKHAAKIAGKDDITMEEAKEIHKCLRKAAGILTAMQNQFKGQLLEKTSEGSDLDPHVIAAYINQCTAEAQEVTIARAIEMKHNPGLISSLAHETSKMFTNAVDALVSLEVPKFGKWKKYLQIKSAFYMAYAYCYAGENLLNQEKCGDAIRALQESEKFYAEAGKLCKEYATMKGSGGVSAKPEQHLFFRRLAPLIRRTLEKCQRENGFIFHQKVPYDVPELELKATYGLASPEDFQMPSPHPLWTPVTYKAFDLSNAIKSDPSNSKAAGKAEGDLPPVKEAPIHQSTQEPKTHSGCVIS